MILALILAATLAAPPAVQILVRAPDGTLAEPTAPLQGGDFSGPGAPPYEGRARHGRSFGYGHAPPQHPAAFGFGTSRTPPHAGAGHRGGPARVR